MRSRRKRLRKWKTWGSLRLLLEVLVDIAEDWGDEYGEQARGGVDAGDGEDGGD